ncbi:MAG: AarF/ABC1/UbiB kinase family protein [Pirellulales bacterium]|nr:AarF/ABC1/UbiB kinase family protein [Pirellulales bacterium]
MKITALPQLLRSSTRGVEVLSVLSKYGLATWFERLDIKIADGFLKSPHGELLRTHSTPTRIRLALQELGPTFIKLGQVLSTRPDIIGVELATELQRLQDQVAADDPATVRRIVEEELGESVDELFASFCDEPLASASIGQVHCARLHTGERVVVKVRHYGIEQKVRVDLDILGALAEMAELLPEFKNYRPKATAAEFQRTLLRELNFDREERNMQEFAGYFADDPRVRIPTTYPEFTTGRVLTMEELSGIKLSDINACARAGHDLPDLARRGAEIYLEMIFTHGFYHADPHPGNLLVLEGNVIGLLDYGMVGRIDDRLREEIEEMLMAVVEGDSSLLTSVITRLGQAPPGMDHSALAADVADFVSQYAHQRFDEFPLAAALNEMTEIIRRYHIMLPARIALLLKVLVMLEGTARMLAPKFNLIEVIAPFQRKMLLRRLSPTRQFRKLRRFYRELEVLAQVAPRGMVDIIEQVQSGKFDVHLDHRGLEPSVNRLVLGMLTSALFLGSALLLSNHVPPTIREVSVLGAVGCGLSLAVGLRLLRAINKSGRLNRRG